MFEVRLPGEREKSDAPLFAEFVIEVPFVDTARRVVDVLSDRPSSVSEVYAAPVLTIGVGGIIPTEGTESGST